MPRLLVCRECQTIETFPLWQGAPEEEARDPMLDGLVQRHVQKHGDMRPDAAALLVASEDFCTCPTCKGDKGTFWDMHQTEVLKGLRERWTGFDPEYYAQIDTFKVDAGRCWSLHRQPKGTDCIDWLDDRKRLTPKNWPQDKSVYLCHFCPVASQVVTAKRHARGMYKRQPGEED
jgi:hypothetical protein